MAFKLRISEKIATICKFVFVLLNILFMLVGLLIIGLSIYLLLYKGDLLSVIFEMRHIKASVIILIFCGSFLLVFSIFALCSVVAMNKYMLLIYIVGMVLCALLAIAAVIMGIIYRNTWKIDELRYEMRDVLQKEYGTNMNKTHNKFITQVWDTVQQFWYCCGVEDNSWGIFRQSEWYNDQPGDPGTKEYTARMVPKSCCVKNQYGKYIDLQKCQNWQLGPPNMQSGLDKNEAVFYRGCFESGKTLLIEISAGVIGLGIGCSFVMFGGAIIALVMCIGVHQSRLKKAKKKSATAIYLSPQNQDFSSDGDRSRDRNTVSPVSGELQPLDKSW